MACQKLLLGFILIFAALAAWPAPSRSQQQIKCGDTIRLTHIETDAHLHSHCIEYSSPYFSGQDQVTAYLVADYNDLWVVRSQCDRPLRHGDTIRLEQGITGKYLHSHPIDERKITAPVITPQQQVTGAGGGNGSDPNDYWVVYVEDHGNWVTNQPVKLIHRDTKAALHSHNNVYLLPRQQEVSAFTANDPNDWWKASFDSIPAMRGRTMKAGDNAYIEYIMPDRTYRRASLEDTTVNMPNTPFQDTTDPRWIVTDPVRGIDYGRTERIEYVGGDGRIWSAKARCQWYPAVSPPPTPDRIVCRFDHQPVEHDGKGHELYEIGFWAWDCKRWNAVIEEVGRPFPATPRFSVKQVR